MTGYVEEWQGLDAQLELHGLQRDDIRWILHTHHHIDHAGQDDRFPNATVITNRRELEFSASGIMGAQYPPEYVKHHIDRLHTPGAMRLLDLELSGPVEVLPGIVCESAGAHTEGSMNILVPTSEGVACMCGDIVYDLQNAVIDPLPRVARPRAADHREPRLTKRQEKAAIKRALNSGTFFLHRARLPGPHRARPRRRSSRRGQRSRPRGSGRAPVHERDARARARPRGVAAARPRVAAPVHTGPRAD